MKAARVTPGWLLLFGAGVLGASLFIAEERSSPHASSEAPPEACAREDDRPAASDPCLEVAWSDRNYRPPGETAWPTPC